MFSLIGLFYLSTKIDIRAGLDFEFWFLDSNEFSSEFSNKFLFEQWTRQQYSTCSNYSTLFKSENIFNCSIKTEMKITEVEIIWTMRWYSPCAKNYSPIRTFIQLNLTFVENFLITYLTNNHTVGIIPIEYCSIYHILYRIIFKRY